MFHTNVGHAKLWNVNLINSYYVTWVPLSMNIHRFVYRSYWLWNSAFFGEFNWRRDLWEFFCYGPRGRMNTRRKLPAILKEWFAPLCQSHPGLAVATNPTANPTGFLLDCCIWWFVVTVAGLEATNFHINSTSRWTFLLTLSTTTTTTIMCCLLHFKIPGKSK